METATTKEKVFGRNTLTDTGKLVIPPVAEKSSAAPQLSSEVVPLQKPLSHTQRTGCGMGRRKGVREARRPIGQGGSNRGLSVGKGGTHEGEG